MADKKKSEADNQALVRKLMEALGIAPGSLSSKTIGAATDKMNAAQKKDQK